MVIWNNEYFSFELIKLRFYRKVTTWQTCYFIFKNIVLTTKGGPHSKQWYCCWWQVVEQLYKVLPNMQQRLYNLSIWLTVKTLNSIDRVYFLIVSKCLVTNQNVYFKMFNKVETFFTWRGNAGSSKAMSNLKPKLPLDRGFYNLVENLRSSFL